MTTKSDIVIIGGGLNGITLACSLAVTGLKITLIESKDPAKIKNAKSDGRCSAIAYGSSKIFEEIGVWHDMKPHAGEILDIRVTDNDSSLFLHYDHSIIGKEPLGFMVENHIMLKALYEKAYDTENINIIAPNSYESIERNQTSATVKLTDGQIIKCSLIVAADGKNSKVRKDAGIKTITKNYNQTGIVCTIGHEKNHNSLAQERFLPTGPFAILPMLGGHHSSLVWTEKTDIAPLYMQMDDKEFLHYIDEKSGSYLGKLTLESQRFSYPFTLSLALTYKDTRLALIGDAAHGMHPLAGQGFNVGIRDIAELTKQIKNAHELGLDIGCGTALGEYNKLRKFDSLALIAITDGLNKLFAVQSGQVKSIRRIGLGLVNKIAPLKRIFMHHAMGISNF